ncbi:LptF/LptG family permease [Desulfurobacterium atlanticum]|uniref:Lipopolysaccharide export system permease protein n=1 Tax=Desulfurobacterium atlanticum TaxID=240169 RepID=A0A238XK18_9BACT|nr:LptF/LptG family permease [Desulfurobacterium atlanticum]SNR59032.1 lipopolysaccharide export system permease protein [Desulfurobacterium atlanticum]
MVKILDGYIFNRVFIYFSLSFLVLMVIFLLVDFVSHVDLVAKGKLVDVLLLVFSRIPVYSIRMLPIATLIGVMVAISELSSTNELVVIKSLGISIYRISVPIFIFASLVVLAGLLITEFFVPKGAALENFMYEKLGKRNKVFYLVTPEVWIKKGNTFFSVRNFDPVKGCGEYFSLIKIGEDFRPFYREDALNIRYEKDGNWKLENVYERDLLREKTLFKKEKVENLGITVKDLTSFFINPSTMELFSLFKLIHHLKLLGYNTTTYEMEFYSRISMPFIVFVVALIGIPLGAFNPRNQKGYTAVVAVGFIVSMWVTVSFFNNLGKTGFLPPVYAAFASHFIFLSIGLILFSRSHS